MFLRKTKMISNNNQQEKNIYFFVVIWYNIVKIILALGKLQPLSREFNNFVYI